MLNRRNLKSLTEAYSRKLHASHLAVRYSYRFARQIYARALVIPERIKIFHEYFRAEPLRRNHSHRIARNFKTPREAHSAVTFTPVTVYFKPADFNHTGTEKHIVLA
jgi:hypothetical protein